MTDTELDALESRLTEEMRLAEKVSRTIEDDELAATYLVAKMKQHKTWATLISAVKKSRRPTCAHCKRPL